jgi:alcohol dehydrogenase
MPERTSVHPARDLSPASLSTVSVVFGPGTLAQIGARTAEAGFRSVLIVTDAGVRGAGHADRAAAFIEAAGVLVQVFDRVQENPTSAHVADGLDEARRHAVDGLVAVGGGSAMDCAKGISLLHSNGGNIAEYRGDPAQDVLRLRRPLTRVVCVPTTAGTGSEAQSFALISDEHTHVKLACGDRRPPGVGLRPVFAILDPDLIRTVPASVAAAAGIDAVAHAVETSGSKARNAESRRLSREAWRLLESAFPRVMESDAAEARADMLLGAHLAGAAIERSMLGAAHACANPLTARCGITHGVAVGLLLPHVVRFNALGISGLHRKGPTDQRAAMESVSLDGQNPYADLDPDAERLAKRLEALLDCAGLPRRLKHLDIPAESLPELAADAASQWTATFNPRSVGPTELLTIYQAAHGGSA